MIDNLKTFFEKTVNLARGALYHGKFDKAGLLQVAGRIRVIKRHGRIEIGRCILWGGVKLSVCGMKGRNAILTIGDYSTIGDRTEIHAGARVAIGKGVLISWDCVIMDRDYHGIGTKPERVLSVNIEDGAWIGCRSVILPGVTIGRGAVIGAGSVVTSDIPPFTVAAGNPARVIKRLDAKH